MSKDGITSLNGFIFEKMVVNGLNNLILNEQKINDMNVFPVADGDTGRNMRLTLQHGVEFAKSQQHCGNYINELSRGMLFGARGNSGVILSQIFKGIAQELARDGIVNPGELCAAFIKGYKVAYGAVVRPVEGTILTVAREGIENIKKYIYGKVTIETELSLYIAEMKKSLSITPEMLSVLKEEGVVDSGAYGYITVIEGMLKYLYGEEIVADRNAVAAPVSAADLSGENDEFTEGYCMEFLLKLKAVGVKKVFDRQDFTKRISGFGNSIIVVAEGDIVKVHIHTHTPSKIIEVAESLGQFVSFKLENMHLMHNQTLERKNSDAVNTETKKGLGIIVCADGDGITQILNDLGATVVLRSGNGTTSVEDFVNAVSKVNAERTVIFPNHENAVGVAEQAVSVAEREGVTVIPTVSVAECYFALAMDIPDEKDIQKRLKMLTEGAKNVTTVSVAKAIVDYGTVCKKGDTVAFCNGKILCVGDSIKETAVAAIKKVSIEGKTAAIVFGGKSLKNDEDIAEIFSAEFPDLEITYVYGGQTPHDLIVGLI